MWKMLCANPKHIETFRVFSGLPWWQPPLLQVQNQQKKAFFHNFFWGIFHNTRNMSYIFNQAISFQKKFQDQPYPLRPIKTKKNTWHRVSHIWKLRNSNKSENDRD